MNKIMTNQTLKIRTAGVFFAVLLAALGCVFLLHQNQKTGEELKAAYTAETTIGRIESQLNKYLAESELVRRTIEEGYGIDDSQFALLSQLMQDNSSVIKAHELAKDGIVSTIYPMEGNEEAIGLDMLENPDRKREACLAKESGQYTIAGPFELKQGGTGALLFDPIYTDGADGQKEFWGFSILVIDWEEFLSEIDLDHLENASYRYQIWKQAADGEGRTVIAESKNPLETDALEVACSVPNDVWYFEIMPESGWIAVSQRWFGLAVSAALAGLLTAWYWQVQIRRIREERYAEEIGRSAEAAKSANAAKTRFLFNMSHDMRTPMNAILGFSDLLEEHIDDRERSMDYIGKIKSSGQFLLSLINYVLETARIESGTAVLNMEVGSCSDLTESLNAVFSPAIRKKELKYTCRTIVDHEYVICDQAKVREILLNIISNAVKYTPKGGSISVEIREILPQKEGCATYQITVEDTGIGISSEYLPHIFEEFTRERSSTESRVAGAGLGLPIVKSLVELMGGTVEVESCVGKGSKFTIVLSLQIAAEEQIAAGKETRRHRIAEELKGKRILLAEDNDLNAEIAETILEENGIEVERAEDGEVCVEAVRKNPEHYYDLILMDIQMPNMDGYTATEKIRNMKNQRASIPIVALTANAFEEDRKKAFAVGMNGHIAKPIDIEILFSTLGQVLI